ncbi:ATP-binding protein [Actinoplanes sp. Pm04-4]|uniref:ATP-binding protein n=1 Tax=Paractinoplanes pyxinae TaxID=2997416 RepID=A0ABT4BB84_9ACTN|nr:ATP-binding protein [Actinoplanes pyxinae]MCY1143781.1 ATP-binding protein [Actinoplanes pyxinae]
MNGLEQTLPPDAVVMHTWVLDSTTELQGLRAALSRALHGEKVSAVKRLGDVPERMVLVATELATNAIRHGLAPTEVRLLRTAGGFLLDVTDQDPDSVPELAAADEQALGGRGLALAQSFALDVGWYCTTSTKHVWATFTNGR